MLERGGCNDGRAAFIARSYSSALSGGTRTEKTVDEVFEGADA